MPSIDIRRSVAVALAGLAFASCAQPGTGERSSDPESSETWRASDTSVTGDEAGSSVDAGGPDEFAEICEKIDSYDERRGEIDEAASGPRTEPAAKYDGFPDESQQVVLHTLDESVATYEEWAPILVRAGGHLSDSVRGTQSLDPRKISSFDGEVSPLQRLVDLLAVCEVDRGLFHSLGGPIVAGERLHLFECAPGMPPLKQNVAPTADPLLEKLQAVWRVDDALVKCAYPELRVEFAVDDTSAPPENLPIAENLSETEMLPDRVRKWLLDILAEEKQRHELEYQRFKEGLEVKPHWSELPYDYYPLLERHFLVIGAERAWNTHRIIDYSGEHTCVKPKVNNLCDKQDKSEDYRFLRPRVLRHWKHKFERKSR